MADTAFQPLPSKDLAPHGDPLAAFSPQHELTFASGAPWRALHAFAEEMAARGADLVGLSAASTATGGFVVRARVCGLDPDGARAAADALAKDPTLTGAQVEHIIWRAQP